MASLKHIMKGLGIAASAVALALSLVSPVATQAAAGEPRDCETFSIIYCGAYTKAELLKKMTEGDGRHSAANIQQIYYKEGRGVTEANFKSASTVDGRVYKDGRVVVNGKTVATGGKAISRTYTEGSTKSGSVWMRPNSQGFAVDSIPAWVNMDGGQFRYYIIKSCGNIGVATPVKTPTPSPTPAPVHEFDCIDLVPTRVTNKGSNDTYRFTVTPKVKNVTITGYRFTFSDGTSVTTAADKPFVEREIKSGSFKVQAQVITNKGETKIVEACTATVNITVNTPSPTPTPTPTPTATPQVLGVTTLPETGPAALLGGIAGLTAVGYAGRSYLRSRKALMDSLRNKNR
ncbi:MAG: hypothetical protein K0S68_16 [Candidatus Saccharibacteria bacterium]|jgi:hypothetical protein|nr:hypothetical protein [Candidatus Saccharibacteria bacterium]